jgi:antitoxin (DNA-binding transcriptional repressor) of toxin-antitoxin stability system
VSEPAITIRAADEPTWAEVVRRAEHGESVSVIAHGDHVADVVPSGELDRLRETIEELRVSPGSIVLSHDGGPEPNATLMQQLDRLVGVDDRRRVHLRDRERAAGRRRARIRGRSPG